MTRDNFYFNKCKSYKNGAFPEGFDSADKKEMVSSILSLYRIGWTFTSNEKVFNALKEMGVYYKETFGGFVDYVKGWNLALDCKSRFIK